MQRLCHMCANKHVCNVFLACAGAPQSRKVPTLTDWGHHVGTKVQHQSSPSFTPFGIVATRWGFREMVKTHGHVSHCLPLFNNKLKVDGAILCCAQLEFPRTSAFVCVYGVYVSRCGASDAHHFFAECFIG